MKSTLWRGLVLALVTAGWMSLSAWVLLANPGAGLDRPAVLRGTSPTDGPPAQSIWDRLGQRAYSLLSRQKPGEARHLDAHELAVRRLGVPAWHRAGFRGKGV